MNINLNYKIIEMNELKYVTFIPKGMNLNGARAIIFNGMFNHKDIVIAMLILEQGTVHGAGFMVLTPDIKVWGQSESLRVGIQPEDEMIIMNTLTRNHTLTDLKAWGDFNPDQLNLFDDLAAERED